MNKKENLPKEYSPITIRENQNLKTRDRIQYVVFYTSNIFVPQLQTDELKEALNFIPHPTTNKSYIIRYNIDGTNTILYEWKQCRNAQPPCWVLIE